MLKFPKGYGLGYAQRILKGEAGFKFPMLVVGANNYVRSNVKHAMLQDWDVHLLFFPTSDSVYRVGALYISRHEPETFLECGEGLSIDEAMKQAFNTFRIDKPIDVAKVERLGVVELQAQAMAWLSNSVYRCPKISLRDVLSLESYNVKKTA